MSSRRKELDELFELIQRFRDEDLTDEQGIRLNQLLSVPELGVEAVAMLDVQAGLQDAMRSNGLGDESQDHGNGATKVVPAPHRAGLPTSLFGGSSLPIWNLAPYALALLLISNLLVGGLVWYAASSNVAHNSQPSGDFHSPPIVRAAQLVSMTSCVWSPSDTGDPAIGRSIATGETLHLLEGIAELDLGCGESNHARVRFEGPGSLHTGDDGSLSLDFGVLTADVAWLDGPFSIDTPSGKIIVRGNASIGVVANSPQHEVHVFRGEATIKMISDRGPTTSVQLTRGEAASFETVPDSEPVVTRFESSSALFASARSMAFDRLIISQNYRDAIKAANPAIYWRFEKVGDDGVANEGNIPGFNAYIDGSVSWRQFGENRAAEFGLTGTVGSFVSKQKWPAKPLENYTVELWAKPSHFHNGALICLVVPEAQSDGRYPHGMFVEFGGQLGRNSLNPLLNNVRFVHRSTPSNDYSAGTSASASGGYRARTWQHVVARKNGEDLELIINGQVVAKAKDPSSLPGNLQIVIGQLFPKLPQRPFVGQIDEVAIYERALRDKEIRSHYQLAKPPRVYLEETGEDPL